MEFNVIMEKLNGFETADEIAAFFIDQGIKATRLSASTCAVTQYIKGEAGHLISTTPYDVADICCKSYVATSPALTEFIGQFDANKYPELVAGSLEEG